MAKVIHKTRGVLPVVAGLLIVSATIRLVGDAGPAVAAGMAEAETPVASEPMPAVAEAAPSMDAPGLMAALQDREERVARREARIADRMQALAVAESEVEEKILALEEAEASLAALLALASTAAEDDLDRLTVVYENMKPTDAAALFETMEPAFSAGFMGRMQPEAAAAIMTNLAPETAYLISVVLAGRNANAPAE